MIILFILLSLLLSSFSLDISLPSTLTKFKWEFINGNKDEFDFEDVSFGNSSCYGPCSNCDSMISPPHADGVSFIRNSELWCFGGVSDGWSYVLSMLISYSFSENKWVWRGGSDSKRSSGTYGDLGIEHINNTVPARDDPASFWIQDKDLNTDYMFIFGGYGCGGLDNCGTPGWYNDLWRYNFKNYQWTWLGGTNIFVAPYIYGKYGTFRTKNSNNWPGGRHGSVSWQYNKKGYMFGGDGFGVSSGAYLSDIWEFSLPVSDDGYWRWIKGSNYPNHYGVCYGSPEELNPGGREDSMGVLLGDNFYLFGGRGYGCDGIESAPHEINDLWSFNMKSFLWTYYEGGHFIDEITTSNRPGARKKGIIFSLDSELLF